MSRRYRIVLGLALVAVVMITGAGFAVDRTAFAGSENAPDAQPGQIPPGWYWSYGVKFVCGFQPLGVAGTAGELIVKPGNYATEVNLHNPFYTGAAPVYKKVVTLINYNMAAPLIVREPQTAGPSQFVNIQLEPDWATMDDCNAIYHMAYPGAVVPSPMALFVGYFVILSNQKYNLDVTAVYTANGSYDPALPPTAVSIDVEVVNPKRIYYP